MLSLIGKSDHVSIIFNIDCSHQNVNHRGVAYAYDKGNYNAMNEELPLVDREFTGKSLNEKWTILK